jgi:hypothetical protein
MLEQIPLTNERHRSQTPTNGGDMVKSGVFVP